VAWISTRFVGTLRFRYVAGDRGVRTGAFDSGPITMAGGCFVAAPDAGGYWLELGRRRIEVVPGSVAVVPPGQPFRMRYREREGMTQHWSLVDYRLFGVIDACSLLAPPGLLEGAAGLAAARCVARLNAAAAACDRLDPVALARRDELGLRLFGLVFASAGSPAGLESRLQAIARVQPALRLMEERLEGDLGRGDLARTLGLSEGRFHAVFTAAMGIAPYAYLARLRLGRAQDLLLATDDAVHRIGSAVGFRDQFHFSRSFKQAFGVSPSGFRTRARAL
jgi:AraC-like DNA-binding protein